MLWPVAGSSVSFGADGMYVSKLVMIGRMGRWRGQLELRGPMACLIRRSGGDQPGEGQKQGVPQWLRSPQGRSLGRPGWACGVG